ncbi:MAG: hypothetical protein ACK5HT_18575 [Draconibacterium sp.]
MCANDGVWRDFSECAPERKWESYVRLPKPLAATSPLQSQNKAKAGATGQAKPVLYQKQGLHNQQHYPKTH